MVVQWGDMDAFGHVNNVSYIKYFESARADYFTEFQIWKPGEKLKEGPVLIRVEMNYRKQVHYPNTLQVTVGLESIARKGFDIGCSIWMGDEMVADGMAKVLWFHFDWQKVVPIPEHLKNLIH